MRPFITEMIYKRSAIHDQFGGNRYGGIAPCAKFPYIFIFTGTQGAAHGYLDGWDNPNIFCYTGEGQNGDMKFVKGNLALREHLNNGKRVFLFEYVRSAYVKFVSELEFHDFDYFETKDSSGHLRVGIKYFFKRTGATLPAVASKFVGVQTVMELDQVQFLDVPNETERKGLVTSRVGQGAYRKRIIHRWQYECAVTGFNKPEILIASHIVPWKDSTDQERLDVNNGILLSPVYDALFDRNIISFENNGKIILSENFDKNAFALIGVNGKEKISNFNSENYNYLERHRQLFR